MLEGSARPGILGARLSAGPGILDLLHFQLGQVFLVCSSFSQARYS